MLKSIKTTTKDLLSSTSIHGIPKIISTEKIVIKVIWSILFLVSFALCAYLVFQSIADYFSYEVITKVRKVPEFPLKFPKIIICNSNPFLNEYSNDFFSSILNNNNNSNNNNTSEFYNHDNLNTFNTEIVDIRLKALSIASSSNRLNDTQKRLLSSSLREFIINCRFSDKACDFENDFEWYFHNFYGNCYVFNSIKNNLNKNANSTYTKNSTKTGQYDGLQIEILLSDPLFKSKFAAIDQAVLLFIKDQEENFLAYDYIPVSTGTETNLVLTKTLTKKLKKPYSDCDLENLELDSHESFIYKEFIIQNMKLDYSIRNCYELCYQYFAIQECSCFDASVNEFKSLNKSACLTEEQIKCVNEFYSIYSIKYKEKCLNLCPIECEIRRFKIETFTSDYPTKEYESILFQNKYVKSRLRNVSNKDTLKKSIAKINIYFESLDCFVISEIEAINIVSLLSNIGGTLGLFLGFSFLSFIEILEVLFEIFMIIYEHMSKKKRKRTKVEIILNSNE